MPARRGNGQTHWSMSDAWQLMRGCLRHKANVKNFWYQMRSPGVCMVIPGDQKGIEPWSDQTEVNSSDNNPGAVYNRFARYLIEGTTSRRVTPHALPAQLLCCLREQDRPTALACLDESEVLPKLCPTISQTAVVAITPAGFSSLIDRNVYRSGDATASSTFGHST